MDEAYYEFLDAPVDLLPLIRYESNQTCCDAHLSKIYGLAGLRIGYGIGHPDFISAPISVPFNTNSTPAGDGRA